MKLHCNVLIVLILSMIWVLDCKANDIKITVENSLLDGSPTPYFRIENQKKMIEIFYTKRNGKTGIINCEQMFQGKYMQLICIAKWFKLNRRKITGVIRYSIKTVDRER